MELTREAVLRFVSYDPDTGAFVRTATPRARHAGRVGAPAGHVNGVKGYVELWVDGTKHLGHRLAWLIMTGAWPTAQVDHRNRIRSDNRWSNLRAAEHDQNLMNCKIRVDNTSGVKGVNFDRARGKWTARLSRKYLGRFDTLFDAAAARRSAAIAAFGQFANE